MILKILAIVFLVLVLLCVLLAQAGDNADARALATLAYIPAGVFGAIDIVLWLIVWLK